MPGIKLSAADLAGAQEVPPAAAAPGGVRLSAADVEGAQDLDAPRTFSGPEAFGLEATNLFGAGPVLRGVLAKIQGGNFGEARSSAQADLDAIENDDEHAWARRAGKLAALGGETLIGGGVGKLVGVGAKAVGAAAKLAPWAEANPILSRALEGIGSGAAYGAASGAGTAASKGEDILPAAGEGAAAGGVLGGVLGGVAGKLGKTLRGAPEAESEDLLRGVSHGTGEKGSATVTARKLIDRDKKDILDTLRADPELTRAVQGQAKEALPVLGRRLEEVGSQLDPKYDVVDQVTGGVSLRQMAEELEGEASRLGKTPLNEKYIEAVRDIRRSAINAWAPERTVFDAEKLIQGGALDGMKAGDAVKLLEKQMKTASGTAGQKSGSELLYGVKPFAGVAERERNKIADLRNEIDRIRSEASHNVVDLDVKVPTRDVRAMVTRLQTRGSQVINPLNPGEASQLKADMAGLMKGFIDSHLDIAAEQSPAAKMAVDGIRAINNTYSALKNMYKAVEQRGWKESTGSVSAQGHLASLLHGGGTVGAVMMAAHGNIPGAAATLAASHLLPKLPVALRAGTSALAQLQRGIESGNPRALALMKTLQAGRNAGMAGAGAVGAATTGTLATQDQGVSP